MELQHFSHNHKLVFNEKNKLDPDEEISCLCFICKLPIFSTPYYSCSVSCNNFFLHKRCAHLPEQLITPFSREYFFAGVDEAGLEYRCDKCNRICDYVVWSPETGPTLVDLLDAFCIAPLEIRVFHGSHEHEMIAVHEEDFFVCGACGLKNEERIRFRDFYGEESIASSIFYWCCWCRLRIHENCATLPNYIQYIGHHGHPLALTYSLPRGDQSSYCCGICSDTITSLGIYFCGTCPFYAHIKCATHHSELYKPVPSREVGELGHWIQLPMENEDRSLVTYILEKEKYPQNSSNKHEHTLIFHETSGSLGRVLCNGCIQPISPPYYSCSQCTDYLLHKSCANLPLSILHPAHREHPLVLKTTNEKSVFFCRGCDIECNGFSYSCNECHFDLDVQCAFLPKSIMHKAHDDKRHVLHLFYDSRKTLNANCCPGFSAETFRYICTSCDFVIHGFCAGLPLWVRHKYDRHPLKLITGPAPITDHRDNYFEEQKSDITAATALFR